MKKLVAKEAIDRLLYCEASVVKDLFSILNRCDSHKAYLVAKKLINSEDLLKLQVGFF